MEEIFYRSVAEHLDERGIHVEESSAESAAADTEGSAQDKGSRPGFGTAERLFIAFVLDGGGQLLGDEFENFTVALGEAGVLVIALDDQRSNAGVASFQRHAQPVERHGSD